MEMEIAIVLLAFEADVDAKNNRGDTLFHYCAIHGHWNVVKH